MAVIKQAKDHDSKQKIHDIIVISHRPNTYIHTYVHTYIHIYIHTYVHMYIHIMSSGEVNMMYRARYMQMYKCMTCMYHSAT